MSDRDDADNQPPGHTERPKTIKQSLGRVFDPALVRQHLYLGPVEDVQVDYPLLTQGVQYTLPCFRREGDFLSEWL